MQSVNLYSYPRSGNTWIRYISEVLTRRPSLGTPDNLAKDPPVLQRMDGEAVYGGRPPLLRKFHKLWQINGENREHPLIVVLRNYKECIVRHHRGVPGHGDLERHITLYFEPVAYYHEHRGARLLIYYEDLITNAPRTVREIGRFLDVPAEAVEAFLADLDSHRRRSVENYPGGSHTGGQSVTFHRLCLSPEQRMSWDRALEQRVPELFEHYLARYRETAESPAAEAIARSPS